MNIKNNKRKKESIEKIEKAFMTLLQDNELSQISVSDICKIAQLNRSTFYDNFADIFMLADTIRKNLEVNLSELYKAEIINGFNSNDNLK